MKARLTSLFSQVSSQFHKILEMFTVAVGYVTLLSDSEKLMNSSMPTDNSFELSTGSPIIAN